MYKNYQIVCKIKLPLDYEDEDYNYNNILDVSSFKDGSFCLLYSHKIEYFSKCYQFLYDIFLDYEPTHLLTFTIKSNLYVIIRNDKSLYLYLLKDEFLYKTQINLKNKISCWTKTKDNKVIIGSKNTISFYEINNNNILRTQNDIKIEEETFIQNSSYFKINEKEKDKIKDEDANTKNLSILKVFESEEDYIIIMKKKLYELNYINEIGDCPECSYYIYFQKNSILLFVSKLNKIKQKIKNIYEIEFKYEYNKYYYNHELYSIIYQKEAKKNIFKHFDDSISDSIGFFKNKVLFYIPKENKVEIIDINSDLQQKHKSILYHSGEIIERYKINFISEKCFLRFKYIYDRDFEDVDEREDIEDLEDLEDIDERQEYNKEIHFINNNKEYYTYSTVLIKEINTLLFQFENDGILTILQK